MDTLQTRCETLWEQRGLSPEQIRQGIAMLTPEAIENSLSISDYQIINAAAVVRLFGGLGIAIKTYLQSTGQWRYVEED